MASALKDRIKERMAATGLTNAQLAAAARVKPPTSFNWASGRTQQIKGEPLLLAAQALGVTPQWLATGLGAKFPIATEQQAAEQESVHMQPTRELDPWIGEALKILESIPAPDRRGAIAVLRSYAQNLGPPGNAEHLPVAA